MIIKILFFTFAVFLSQRKKLMEKYIHISLQVLQNGLLTPMEKHLRHTALEAAERAYAPYSGFQVGAAVLLENGQIFEGNNQENAAYPVGICAERVALFTANAAYPHVPVQIIAIAAIKNGETEDSISPCGICRQVLLEAENRYKKPVRILLCGKRETTVVRSAKDLLPLAFETV
jgi:cytidine deaminase